LSPAQTQKEKNMTEKGEAIAKLNDAFRTQLKGGRPFLTAGLVGRSDLDAILQKVRQFDSFNEGNNPFGERDFGSFDHGGDQIFWKIDYYDKALQMGSPDPSDPEVTSRVLTVMLASEY
jgi:hypothetical protein